MVNHLVTLGYSKIAFAHNDNPGAREGMERFKYFVEQSKQELVGVAPLANDGSDAESKAVEMSKLRPTAIGLMVTNLVAAKFIRAYRTTGQETHFYAISFLNGLQLQNEIGADASGVVISQVVPYPWGKSMRIVEEYQAAMKSIGENQLTYGSLEGFIAAKILVQAIRRAGPNPIPETVKKSLESMGRFDLGGLEVRYAPGAHEGLSFSELTMIRKDGGFSR